jgi:hypothetical protein
MKSRQEFKLVPRWEPEKRFAVRLHRRVAVARHARDLIPEDFLWLEKEARRISVPLL